MSCSWISRRVSFLHLPRFRRSLKGVLKDSSICRSSWGRSRQPLERRPITLLYGQVAEVMAIKLKRIRVLVQLIEQLFAILKTQASLDPGSWLLLAGCTRLESHTILWDRSRNSESRDLCESLKTEEWSWRKSSQRYKRETLSMLLVFVAATRLKSPWTNTFRGMRWPLNQHFPCNSRSRESQASRKRSILVKHRLTRFKTDSRNKAIGTPFYEIMMKSATASSRHNLVWDHALNRLNLTRI